VTGVAVVSTRDATSLARSSLQYVNPDHLRAAGIVLSPPSSGVAATTDVITETAARDVAAKAFSGFPIRDAVLTTVSDERTGLNALCWVLDLTPASGVVAAAGPAHPGAAYNPKPQTFMVLVIDAHTGQWLFARAGGPAQ